MIEVIEVNEPNLELFAQVINEVYQEQGKIE